MAVIWGAASSFWLAAGLFLTGFLLLLLAGVTGSAKGAKIIARLAERVAGFAFLGCGAVFATWPIWRWITARTPAWMDTGAVVTGAVLTAVIIVAVAPSPWFTVNLGDGLIWAGLVVVPLTLTGGSIPWGGPIGAVARALATFARWVAELAISILT